MIYDAAPVIQVALEQTLQRAAAAAPPPQLIPRPGAEEPDEPSEEEQARGVRCCARSRAMSCPLHAAA